MRITVAWAAPPALGGDEIAPFLTILSLGHFLLL